MDTYLKALPDHGIIKLAFEIATKYHNSMHAIMTIYLGDVGDGTPSWINIKDSECFLTSGSSIKHIW